MFILSKNCFALVLALGLVLSNVDVSGALKCYQCGSLINVFECGSDKKGEETDCSLGLSARAGSVSVAKQLELFPTKALKAMCLKQTQGSTIRRLCFAGPDDAKMQCTENEKTGGTDCVCDSDLCNHGPTTRLSQLLIPVLGLTTLLAYHRNNGLL